MLEKQFLTILGQLEGKRIESRILEETIQEAVAKGQRYLKVIAHGQHGIGGRLWKAGDEHIHVIIDKHPGQRVGSLGYPNTLIEVMGSCSDDTGWLNAGAEIIVHGDASNGTANGMAQGKIFIAGSIGARGMTMTKHNPRFEPPELWVLGSAGDYFGEFMAGGISVICGYKPQDPENILGYRPLVGMVRGKVFFRGPMKGFSQVDAKLIPISDADWDWLKTNLKSYLEKIEYTNLFPALSKRSEWQLIAARLPQDKYVAQRHSIASFNREIWQKELGRNGLIGDLSNLDRSAIPLITTGELRRMVPVWENRLHLAPCQSACPTGIPVQDRWRLIREGRIDEAVDLALAYTPFPATICGYLCPNLCMQSCTRQSSAMAPVDVRQLGRASLNADICMPETETDRKIAVIGGGPAGISVAWQLRRQGHSVVIYDRSNILGGKMSGAIPESRIPAEVIDGEINRVKSLIPHINLQQNLDAESTERIIQDHDFTVIAVGAQKPALLPVPGKEHIITSLEFLTKSKTNSIKPGQKVIVIGAGDVGCDVATEAHRLGAVDITLIDIQKPAASAREKAAVEKISAKFVWPVFTKEITNDGVILTNGDKLPADTVVMAIGDRPDLGFLPAEIETERGYIKVNELFQTNRPNVFAIGDVVKPGLLTEAIGAGRRAAETIAEIVAGRRPAFVKPSPIDIKRVTTEYFDPRIIDFENLEECGSQCASCGACRDCGLCVNVCPRSAISRRDLSPNGFEYTVKTDLCIGCGFCAGACPCGIWNLMPNDSME